ncbi:hypothetical protein EK21DRAFT_112379 [Setomelanomma holmii]|uniref:Uncharacterized protein n=1 Tax=Setomelanomma holmii TaxID=210430 RepID=A0A9P4LLK4_9PLEO|nr:hypothetical protein EK21DRAFT_112379 [Setomelanomma holmii]
MADPDTYGTAANTVVNRFYVSDAELAALIDRLGTGDDDELTLLDKVLDVIETVKENVLADWARLSAIVRRHEATLWKRWMKKSQAKRQEVLLNVWPHMPRMHRPDIQNWAPEHERGAANDAWVSMGGLWQYINVEDLTEGKIAPHLQ